MDGQAFLSLVPVVLVGRCHCARYTSCTPDMFNGDFTTPRAPAKRCPLGGAKLGHILGRCLVSHQYAYWQRREIY